MHSRRDLLSHAGKAGVLLASAGLLPGRAQAQATGYESAAFDAKNMADVMKALGVGSPVESKDVTLSGPDIAEDGANVPIGLSTALPGVRRMLILVEKNPSMLSAMFDVGDAIEASFATRVKMAQSSNVYAVALMADGRALFAQKEVRVTLGGCGS